MNLKGIVKIAVFSVIGFVLTMGLGFLTGSFGMLPSLYLSSALPTIIVAPVFVIMCKQVGQRGTAFLYFLLMGVLELRLEQVCSYIPYMLCILLLYLV